MNEIKRYEINENWAHSGIIKAGDFYFLNYCVRNIDDTIEQQINGAFDVMANILYASQSRPNLPIRVICCSKWML